MFIFPNNAANTVFVCLRFGMSKAYGKMFIKNCDSLHYVTACADRLVNKSDPSKRVPSIADTPFQQMRFIVKGSKKQWTPVIAAKI